SFFETALLCISRPQWASLKTAAIMRTPDPRSDAMNYRHLVLDLDRARHVATVTLNKPERLNAIDQDDKKDLLDAIARIQGDDDIWVAIWTGAGRGFCSRADLQGPPP